MMSDEELNRIVTIIENLKGIGAVSIVHFDRLLEQGDLGQTCVNEFHAWLKTAEGRFAKYRAENGGR